MLSEPLTEIQSHPLEAEACWQALVARDPAADGRFVYGVRSTGIYCRPTCPARRPLRAQVVFFRDPAAARGAGFRACKRCQPDVAANEREQLAWVQAVCRLIEADPSAGLTLEQLGAQVGVSPTHLQRVFKRLMGVSPKHYAANWRRERLKAELQAGEDVTTSLYAAGYGSSSRVYEGAGLGMTPGTYARGGADIQLRYTVVDCVLGRLLVAATERGLCVVSLGDDDTALIQAVRAEYPAAQLVRDDTGLDAWVGCVVRHLAGEAPHLALPLDVRATAFQARVWQALQAIPYGQTRSYQEVAHELGMPKAARAVAGACARNPVAVVIPCHRVVREDGGLGGYRWGIARKAALLAQEADQGPASTPG